MRNHAAVWLVAAILVTGCATSDQFRAASRSLPEASVEIHETPFFPQTTDLCGPAALATILTQSGVEVTLDEIRSAVHIPDRGGSLQVELVAAMRGRGRVPYEIDPDLSALIAELEAGRPVLVLQNLGMKIAPIWHYAVVIGYSAADKQVVLRSGGIERHVLSERKFLRSWRRGGYWAAVALRPEELPTVADERRYLGSVASLESVGQYAVAERAYGAALARWPQSTVALLGLGNARYGQGDLIAAEKAYRDLLAIKPDYWIARNNLAQTLAERGCVSEAMDAINTAIELATSESLLDPLMATRAAVAAASQSNACSSALLR
jgi:tetratricopeptide (TPR) repeat protein